MKIMITGSTGFVGSKLAQKYPDAVLAPSLRNYNEEQIKTLAENSHPDVILHTAAISDIATCEANPEQSYHANVLLPVYLAKATQSSACKLICFSSDQVYSGCRNEGPYTEDTVNPANLYAKHKLEMEQRVLELCPDSVMLRAEWMYDFIALKPNYYLNIWNAEDSIAFSSRQYRGVTYVKEVADKMERVISLPGGIYNFGSETTRSIYEITKEFLTFIGKDVELLDRSVQHNLWMDCSKARKEGVDFPEVLESLKQCYLDQLQIEKECLSTP